MSLDIQHVTVSLIIYILCNQGSKLKIPVDCVAIFTHFNMVVILSETMQCDHSLER